VPSLPDLECVGDKGTHRCCQHRTCEDRDHHEPCAPEPVEVAEKISVNGQCEEVVRRVRVDEVAARRKLVHGCANKNRL
jgi:hypothetical protein